MCPFCEAMKNVCDAACRGPQLTNQDRWFFKLLVPRAMCGSRQFYVERLFRTHIPPALEYHYRLYRCLDESGRAKVSQTQFSTDRLNNLSCYEYIRSTNMVLG